MSLRNVIYYSDDTYPLTDIVNLPYTDVIIVSLYPDDNYNLYGDGGAFTHHLQSDIAALQNAGKNVLISFGGTNSSFLSSAYRYYAQNVDGLVQQIVSFVTTNRFNGVDIDYEDDAGFGENATYDGIEFLSELTSGLYQALAPSGRAIITHAPSTPFWDSTQEYATHGIAPYTRIWQNVGTQIAWINNQFYENSDYDQTAALKVYWYQQVAAITGPQKLLVGELVGDPARYKKDTDEGYIPLDQMINQVIKPLKAQFGSQFGGVTGWEFAQDGQPTYDREGTWANGIGQALSNLFVFHPGSNDPTESKQLWFSVYDQLNTSWQEDTQVLNLAMAGSPSPVLWKDGISVLYQGIDENVGQLWYTFSSDGKYWGPGQQVYNVGISDDPSAVVYNGKLYVFHQGIGENGAGQLWYSVFDGTSWTEDRQIHNLGMSGAPSAVLWQGGITVFHQGANNNGQLWYTYSQDGKYWGNPKTDSQVKGVTMSASPSAVVYNGVLYAFYQGGDSYTGQLWYSTYDGTHWGQRSIQPLGISESPSAVLWQGGISVFHQGANYNGQIWYTFYDGSNWGTDTPVRGPGMSHNPSCVVF